MYIEYKQREVPLELSNKYYVSSRLQNGIYNLNEDILKIWHNTKRYENRRFWNNFRHTKYTSEHYTAVCLT